MKKFVAALAALVCVLGLSVMSFAYEVYNPSDFYFVKDKGDYYSVNSVFKVASLSSDALEYWKECMRALTGNSPKKLLISCHSPSSSPFLTFFLVDPGSVSIAYNASAQGVVISGTSGNTVSSISFNVNDGSFRTFMPAGKSYYSLSGGAYSVFWGFSSIQSPPASTIYWDWGGKRLLLEDDLEDEVPPDPEEPDTPSSSEPDESIPDTPPPPPYNPTIPTIPEGGKYVPYDTSVWYTFLDRIKTNIGSATNIGFLIFGVSVVWAILTRIVKRFTKAD